MRRRPWSISVPLIIVTIAAGLTLRLARLGLPFIVVKYGGSLLWALLIYWLVSSIRDRWSPLRSALVASAVAGAVELFKRYHAPRLDAFRQTLPGLLLLGQLFSPRNLVAYGVAIVVAASADYALRRPGAAVDQRDES